MKTPLLTNTVKRIAVWYASVMILFYLMFNIFILIELDYIIVDDLDTRLTHELEHILHTFQMIDDTLHFSRFDEFNEPDLYSLTENPYFLQIYDLEGYIIFESHNIALYENIDLGFPDTFTPYYFEDVKTSKDLLRSVYKEIFNIDGSPAGYIQLSTIQSSFNEALKSVLIINLFILPIVIIVIIALSIFLAKKSYEPINKIILLADSISASNLSKRITHDADPNDELGKLRNTLNSLFERLENQVKEISQFTDNASHQLMTPLTAMKAELDYILKRDYPIEEYKETLEVLKSQTDRMILMIRSMLIMSRECERCGDDTNVFHLSNNLRNNITKIYPDANIEYEIEDKIYVRGKSEYFSLVIQNLINNAIKYSPENSPVKVELKSENGKANLRFIDQGIGIKDEEKIKVFQRFYRSDSKEVQNISGYGLGLSLVQSVTESMGGSLKILDNEPKGSIFEITLPILQFN